MAISANQFRTEWSYVEESTWGTTPATPEMRILPVLSGDLGLSRDLRGAGYAHADRSQGKTFPGKYAAGGQLMLAMQLENIGTLLKHAIGGTVQTSGTGPYTHIIPGGDLPAGLTIEKWLPDLGAGKSYQYPGSRIRRMRLIFSGDQLRAEIDFLSKTEVGSETRLDVTPTVVLSTDLDPFSSTIKRGGSLIAGLIDGEVTIENDIPEDEFTLLDQGRYALPVGARRVFGKINGFFESETEYTAFLNATEDIHEFYIGSGTGSLKVEIFSALLTGKPIQRGERQRAGSYRQAYDYEGNPNASFNNIKVTLVNSQATI